jgi:hypothetical protein
VNAASCQATAEEKQVAAELRSEIASRGPNDHVGRYKAVLSALSAAASAYARCPALPNSAAKISAYRATYIETAAKCARVSGGATCVASVKDARPARIRKKS